MKVLLFNKILSLLGAGGLETGGRVGGGGVGGDEVWGGGVGGGGVPVERHTGC